MEGSTDRQIEDAGRQRAAGRAGKSAAAFRTISEVAGELDVAQHVLRFWESKFPQVRPLKRGGGRRYYRPEDVDLLRQIRSLLYEEGYTIKGAQKLLRSQRRGPAIDDGEAHAEADAPVAEARSRPRPELVPEVRRRLLELREELAALRDALREVAG
jgi:DNA-binding transcriptional MerR regulator